MAHFKSIHILFYQIPALVLCNLAPHLFNRNRFSPSRSKICLLQNFEAVNHNTKNEYWYPF
jgi:hypothetical protein